MCTAGTLVVDRERFQTGRTTDIDNLTGFSFKTDKASLPVAEDRADDKQTLARFAFQHERKPRMTLKFMGSGKD
jgi:hypothetical protein